MGISRGLSDDALPFGVAPEDDPGSVVLAKCFSWLEQRISVEAKPPSQLGEQFIFNHNRGVDVAI